MIDFVCYIICIYCGYDFGYYCCLIGGVYYCFYGYYGYVIWYVYFLELVIVVERIYCKFL